MAATPSSWAMRSRGSQNGLSPARRDMCHANEATVLYLSVLPEVGVWGYGVFAASRAAQPNTSSSSPNRTLCQQPRKAYQNSSKSRSALSQNAAAAFSNGWGASGDSERSRRARANEACQSG